MYKDVSPTTSQL